MEQVIPGADPSELDDPIIRSNELKAGGSVAEAHELLLELMAAGLRCLDAHAHQGTRFTTDCRKKGFAIMKSVCVSVNLAWAKALKAHSTGGGTTTARIFGVCTATGFACGV